MTQLNRRALLRAAVIGATGAAIGTGATTAWAGGRGTPELWKQTRKADWAALAKDLTGKLYQSNDTDYDKVRLLFNPRFDHIKPQAVASVETAQDVAACVEFAKKQGVPITVRSGGHNYAGWSTGEGLVVDVRKLNSIELVAGNDLKLGGGVKNIDAYQKMDQLGVLIPAGSCATVGVAGLTLGGGIGAYMREFGLTCDRLRSVQIATPDHGLITATEHNEHQNLLWALKGGGGGNFGIVTSMELSAVSIAGVTFTSFYARWKPEHIAKLGTAWQTWMHDPLTPRRLWSALQVTTWAPGGQPTVHGLFMGDQATLQKHFTKLFDAVGEKPAEGPVYTPHGTSLLKAALYWANCGKLDECRLPDQGSNGKIKRVRYAAKSHIVHQPMDSAALNDVGAVVKKLRELPGGSSGGMLIDALGGAVADTQSANTAFPHRKAVATIQYLSEWDEGTGQTDIDRRRQWLRDAHTTMQTHLGAGAYINYPDPELTGWENAYYAGNYGKLQHIKSQYDRHELFKFAQSIKPTHTHS